MYIYLLNACNVSDSNMAAHDEGITETPPVHVNVDIPTKSEQSRRRVLHRVPPQLRENKNHIYDPVVLPLGPYHHGRPPQSRLAEQLKDEVCHIVCEDKDEGFLRSKISDRMDEIRHFYGGAADYGDDEELAEMMLRDACFVSYYIQNVSDNFQPVYHRLGMSGCLFMSRDFLMLENQIPLWLIHLLIDGDDDGDGERGRALLCSYLSLSAFGDDRMTQLPWGNEEEEPLHLLEAAHRTCLTWLAETEDPRYKIQSQPIEQSSKSTWEMVNSPFRSVTDLKAKGIHFGASSQCLRDIRFSSFSFYGELRLPMFCVTHNSNVFFSNVIAFEMSPATATDYGFTRYVNFMKTLIEKAKDVKELREKGILYSLLASDEEVVGMFKGIDTYGFGDVSGDVKMRMERHCNNKAKTWMAELLHTYFSSPWTAIALFAAIFVLFLSLIQTYYTIHPAHCAG